MKHFGTFINSIMFETNLNKKQIDIVHFTIFNLCLDLD